MNIPTDVKCRIASIVRAFAFDHYDGGVCVARALIGQQVFDALGIDTTLVFGSMLFRCGKHRTRDTLRFADHQNVGRVLSDCMIGHCWLELGDDLIDFSAGDWKSAQPLFNDGLGAMNWVVEPPEFILQPAGSLKRPWRQKGVPEMGKVWYGGWIGTPPNYELYRPLLARTNPVIL